MAPVRYHLGKFPPQNIDLAYLSNITGQASIALGRYDGLLSAIPNADLLLSPLRTQEAVLSSSIEGTRVTMSEVLEIEAGAGAEGITQSKRDDTEEIINYREALYNCAEEISLRPISPQMIRMAHAMLMRGVRGKDKTPGEFRHEQNWIGTPHCAIAEAGFVPVAPEYLSSGMEAWSNYINSEQLLNPLIKLAIIHVEFEALHPFLDGNGRLGRMLIPLYLFQEKILANPSFYMSAYLEKYREEYQDRMRRVSSHDEWTQWIEFFVKGIGIQAEENTLKARKILALYNEMKDKILNATHSQYASRALDFIFRWVFFSTNHFCSYSKIPNSSARNILKQLSDAGIIDIFSRGAGRRPSFFWFRQLRDIVDPKPAANK
ncbi:Fic family protein [Desulfovibrio sp. OttesenSCG-928-C06]|nr:Fic family protein [Desulfovibrio sp. OttesenSCG-928-C06]